MNIKILKDEFINSNMRNIPDDVASIFRIDSNFGLQGQLLTLKKSQQLSALESLHILLGRLACIGEAWNYHLFTEESWKTIFGQDPLAHQYILKIFQKTEPQRFSKRFSQFSNYFSSTDDQSASSIATKHQYLGEYNFNGHDINHYFSSIKPATKVPALSLEELGIHAFTSVYINEEKWNWKLWFIETSENYFLFEETIVS